MSGYAIRPLTRPTSEADDAVVCPGGLGDAACGIALVERRLCDGVGDALHVAVRPVDVGEPAGVGADVSLT